MLNAFGLVVTAALQQPVHLNALRAWATPALRAPCRVSHQRTSMYAAAEEEYKGVVAKTQTSPHKSALILGWFFATERELEYVRRTYQKKFGFDDVVVAPSKVIDHNPRSWCRAMRRRLGGSSQPPHALDRHFDVVHACSGGFLALFVLLRSGVSLRFNQLLLDSTSFSLSRFSLFPLAAHQLASVIPRFSIGSHYCSWLSLILQYYLWMAPALPTLHPLTRLFCIFV